MSGSGRSRLLRLSFLVAALGLLTAGLVGEWDDVRRDLARIGLGPALAAQACVLLGLGASALSWRAMLAGLGVALPVRTAARIFFIGQLGKYLPGAVWPVVTQMRLGREHGAPRRQVGAATAVYVVLLVVTALLLAAVALPLSSPGAVADYWWLFAVLPVGLVVLHPRVLGPLLDRLLGLLRREPLPHRLGGRAMAASLGWTLVMWVCYAAHLTVLAVPLGARGTVLPLLALGAFCLAWAAGPLLVIAPAGLGVREAVLVVAFAPVLDRPGALAVALVSRLAMALGDVGWAAAGAAGARGHAPVRTAAEPVP
jgi:uncharacterized membrane protein YbhN (UPF0104 family)